MLVSIFRTNYKMSTQGNARNSQSATSIFFEGKANSKIISKPTTRQREDPNSQFLAENTKTSSSLSQVMLQIPTDDFKCKAKIALKLNSLNDKKAR